MAAIGTLNSEKLSEKLREPIDFVTDPDNITRIDATKDPSNDLKFLEDTFDGQDWHACLAYADASPDSQMLMQRDAQHLRAQGYVTSSRRDADGKLILLVHHLGSGTAPGKILQELGAGEGTRTLLTHPGIITHATGNLIGKAVHWVDSTIHDPVKADGLINTVAEVALMSAGFFNHDSKTTETVGLLNKIKVKLGALKQPKNLLHTLGGMFFFSQSFIYMAFAKTNDEITLNQMEKKLARLKDQHGDIAAMHFDPATDTEKHGPWHGTLQWIRKYPVQIGAMMNNIGMVLYGGHAFFERRWNKAILANPSLHSAESLKVANKYNLGLHEQPDGTFKKKVPGFVKDIISSSISILAWTSYMFPRKERTQAMKEAHAGNPFASMWDSYRENPQHLAGVTMLGSSTLRFLSSGDKGNAMQRLGEVVYMFGDVAMIFTKNDEYGGKATKDLDELADKIAAHINSFPHLFGPAAQREFVVNVAEYLKRKAVEDAGKDPEKKLHFSMAELDERRDHLARVLQQRVQGGDRFESLAYKLAELVNLFPTAQRDNVRTKLLTNMQQLPWLEASVAELNEAVSNAPIAKRPEAATEKEALNCESISKHIQDILSVVPDINTGGAAIAIKHAVDDFMPHATTAPMHAAPPRTTVSHIAAQPLLHPAGLMAQV